MKFKRKQRAKLEIVLNSLILASQLQFLLCSSIHVPLRFEFA